MSETSQDALARLAALPTANIGDAMDRLGVLDSRIRPIWPGARVAGRAFTIWTRSGDNALIHQALDVVEPGDVIVVNGGGDESRALIGELIGQRAKNKGVAGFVIDGAVRDADGLGEMGMPVFARAVTPAGPYKNGPGHLGRTVAVGGVAVAPGDLILGDADGVVVVPLAEAERVARAAEAVFVTEEGKRAAILESA
ncbi:methyltransferase [Nonomuraea angiospora]|uniref:Putative 4-hydroxy-4-methyl-2-oxoglutarate aldolase n=1 Tax=Nonomuraea angiospora TaxID=46172 RepID=A0ABR9LXB8_9ACTN|nr:methyltransferase [Nonomuraea angiospora]MBE1585290.1 RraA family protein [Nonomuraea angiospora]MDX3106308.1 methyltransferase [Nonomuraea angiospora]